MQKDRLSSPKKGCPAYLFALNIIYEEKIKQDQYSVYERRGQLVFALNCEKMIPEDAPVRLVSAMLEELNYEALYRAYSPRGRKSAADPQVMFEVLVYGYLCGIYSSRKLEEACRYRVDFMWLMGETDHGAVFVDGTKLESRAGRYTFVWRKSEAQRTWERLSHLLEQWKAYESQLFIMGDGRNSYSKTDEDATFMRMKEDHMRNGQLKPGYHVQIGVNSEYITGIEVFSDRSDVKTLKPFLRRLEGFHRARYEDVVADAGYESLENDLYLDATGQACFIKPTNYDQQKSKKFQKQTGRIENMTYGPEQPKQLCLQKTFWEKRAETTQRITSQRGIHLRLCRFIQVEGAFALLKNDFGFRRFLTRGRANIRSELFLLAIAFDLKKLWIKREHGRLQTRVSEKMTA